MPLNPPDSLAGTPLFKIGTPEPKDGSTAVGVESVFANFSSGAIVEINFYGVGDPDSVLRYFDVQSQPNFDALGPGNTIEDAVTEYKRDLAIGSSRVRITELRLRLSDQPKGDENGSITRAAVDPLGFTHFATNRLLAPETTATPKEGLQPRVTWFPWG